MVANEKWFGAVTGFYNDQVSRSLRFEQSDSPDLSLSSLSGGSTTKATIAFWCKRGDLSDDMRMWSCYDGSGTNRNQIGFLSGDTLNVQIGDTAMRTTTRVFRDVSAWYHIVVAFDSSQSTANDRIKIYVNGVQETDFSTTNNPSQDADIKANNGKIYWGRRETSSLYFDGYLAECVQIDGAQLAGTSFGEFKEGVFIPIDISGLTYGTNGHRLQYLQTGTSQNSSGIGADTSGNNKHFAVTNLAATDIVLDCPENNFCTMSPLVRNPDKGVFTQGNLQTTSSGSPAAQSFGATFAVASGKWYWEGYIDATSSLTPYMAVVSFNSGSNKDLNGNANTLEGDANSTDKYIAYGQTGVRNGSHGYSNILTTNITTIAQGQIIGFALDMDNKELRIYNNGSAQYSGNSVAVSGDLVGFVMPAVSNYLGGGTDKITMNFGQDSSFAGAKTRQNNQDENSKGDFYYAPPSSYLALCNNNFSESVLGPNSDDQPNDFVTSNIWAGNQSTQNITGLNFQPDMIFAKRRGGVQEGGITTSVGGVNLQLRPNANSVGSTNTNVVTSFNSDGWTMGADSGNSFNHYSSYVGWVWKAGGVPSADNSAGAGYTPTTNSVKIDGSNLGSALSGTIAATRLSASTTAGFSIVKYTGNEGSSDTVAHGLSKAPEMIWWFPEYADDKSIFHKSIGNGNVAILSQNTAGLSTLYGSTIMRNTDPTTTVVPLGASGTTGRYKNNKSGETYYMMCWHGVDGYSSFGQYEGNGNSDGAMVFTGFRPRIVAFRNIDSANGFLVFDVARNSINTRDKYIYFDLANAEGTSSYIDFLSNGFKFKTSAAGGNSSNTFIYAAWAEMPFKYGLAE